MQKIEAMAEKLSAKHGATTAALENGSDEKLKETKNESGLKPI